MRRIIGIVAATSLLMLAALAASGAAVANTPTPFFNGFETDTHGWNVFGGTNDATRVPSGTHGVTSATGAYHAEAATGDLEQNDGSAATNWGGYSSTFPSGGYTTAVDIYLNPASITTNDTRFEWDSAVSNSSGGFERDFVFNAGGYTDTDTTGSGPRFVVSASNNAGRSGAFPKNPGRDPFTIATAGWYTFQHRFYNNAGVLAVDLRILDANGVLLHSWTLSDPSDSIATTGGNRYGWFDLQEFPFLAFDNSRLSVQVGPPTSTDQCKKDGWKAFNNPAFKNQGDCVSYVATGGRNPGNG